MDFTEPNAPHVAPRRDCIKLQVQPSKGANSFPMQTIEDLERDPVVIGPPDNRMRVTFITSLSGWVRIMVHRGPVTPKLLLVNDSSTPVVIGTETVVQGDSIQLRRGDCVSVKDIVLQMNWEVVPVPFQAGMPGAGMPGYGFPPTLGHHQMPMPGYGHNPMTHAMAAMPLHPNGMMSHPLGHQAAQPNIRLSTGIVPTNQANSDLMRQLAEEKRKSELMLEEYRKQQEAIKQKMEQQTKQFEELKKSSPVLESLKKVAEVPAFEDTAAPFEDYEEPEDSDDDDSDLDADDIDEEEEELLAGKKGKGRKGKPAKTVKKADKKASSAKKADTKKSPPSRSTRSLKAKKASKLSKSAKATPSPSVRTRSGRNVYSSQNSDERKRSEERKRAFQAARFLAKAAEGQPTSISPTSPKKPSKRPVRTKKRSPTRKLTGKRPRMSVEVQDEDTFRSLMEKKRSSRARLFREAASSGIQQIRPYKKRRLNDSRSQDLRDKEVEDDGVEQEAEKESLDEDEMNDIEENQQEEKKKEESAQGQEVEQDGEQEEDETVCKEVVVAAELMPEKADPQEDSDDEMDVTSKPEDGAAPSSDAVEAGISLAVSTSPDIPPYSPCTPLPHEQLSAPEEPAEDVVMGDSEPVGSASPSSQPESAAPAAEPTPLDGVAPRPHATPKTFTPALATPEVAKENADPSVSSLHFSTSSNGIAAICEEFELEAARRSGTSSTLAGYGQVSV